MTEHVEKPRVEPVEPERASAEVESLLEEIRSAMDLPWVPSTWRAYAAYPRAMTILWSRLEPVVTTESFLQASFELVRQAYRRVEHWRSDALMGLPPPGNRKQLSEQVEALVYANGQSLLQQTVLQRLVRNEASGRQGQASARVTPRLYGDVPIQAVDPASAPPGVRELYQEIQETLGLPLLNTAYQVLGQDEALLAAAWSDLRAHRQSREYFEVCGELTHLAQSLTAELSPAASLDTRELIVAVGDNRADLANLTRTVESFTAMLPGLLVNDSVILAGLDARQLGYLDEVSSQPTL